MHRLPLLIAMTFIAGFSSSGSAQRQTAAPVSGYQVVRVYPHDRQAFTQGLVVHEGTLAPVASKTSTGTSSVRP